jgi:hypothetical protein
MYKVQRYQLKPRYNDHSNMDEIIMVLMETKYIPYEEIPGFAHQIGASVERVQAMLENRADEIKTGDGAYWRPYPYTFRKPREVEPLESPSFVKQMEARNTRIKRNGKTGSTLEGWESRTSW